MSWKTEAARVFDAAAIRSAREFSFAGKTIMVGAQAGGRAADYADGKNLIAHLAAVFYDQAYSRPFSGVWVERVREQSLTDESLVEALSQANRTKDRWEEGWSITSIFSQGQIMATKRSAQRMIWPGQYLSEDGPAAMPRVGARVRLFYARESRSLQNGFYYAFSETPEDVRSTLGLIRIYWNVMADGAPRLLDVLAARLNTFHVPYRFKCAVDRREFERTDVAVLYLPKQFFSITADLLRDVTPAVREHLGQAVPLFSKRIDHGTALAEDPGNGESFGQSRCRLLASAIWNQFQAGHQGGEACFAEFSRLLASHGIDRDRPYLNIGTADRYHLPSDSP